MRIRGRLDRETYTKTISNGSSSIQRFREHVTLIKIQNTGEHDLNKSMQYHMSVVNF